MAVNTDLALQRRLLLDNSRKNSRGQTILRPLYWYSVVYSTGSSTVAGLEPVDYTTMPNDKDGDISAANDREKEITGFEFSERDRLTSTTFSGGDVGFPR